MIDVDGAALDDLRARLRHARWPERETAGDWSQGVPLDYLQDLCSFWADRYDWRAAQARLNRLPQFVTRIDGLGIHFLHIRSAHPDAMPLIMTHGWPGSFLEFEQALGPLADPAAHGGDPADAFHVVVPSLPGYGFSGKPAATGWDIHHIARAWAELMTRLGYERFLAEGADWGTSVSTSLALQDPDRLVGIHVVPPLAPPDRRADDLTDRERAALADLEERSRTGSGYSAMHGTRPQTIGYSLLDSPAGLCAWIVEKLWAWTDHRGDLGQVLTADQVLDNITLYWLTGTGASSARLYWESIAQVTDWFTTATSDTITVPTGCSIFPKEVPRPSRRQAERRFANIVHWNELDRGGHFAAWEQPGLFIDEVRAVARSCRRPLR
ncbi:MAG: epoxide hydrolase [Streptosporangiaceae bacterium]|jgi:pimeloyl-ACP methyl ester carboxylesterase|nr:epoxide hydrolase [Streptosporangiaceae bacterium]